MNKDLIIGGVYRHYKRNLEYVVLDVGRDSETLDEVVVYQGQYNDERFGEKPIWIRPKDEFLSDVELDGTKVPRFKFIRESKGV